MISFMSNTKTDICPVLLEVRKVFTLKGMVSGRAQGDSRVLVILCVLICVLVTGACSTMKTYPAEQLCALSVCNILFQ